MKQTKAQQKESVKTLEAFNDNLIKQNCCLVLHDTDMNRPIAAIKPNVLDGLCPAIINAIKDDKGIDDLKVKVLSMVENRHSYILEIKVEVDDNGESYEQEYEGYSIFMYNN